MKTNVSEEILGLRYKYFINDYITSNSIGIKKEWEPHITKFTRLYNSLFNKELYIGANFGYHTLLFSQVCSENVYAFEPQFQSFKLLEDNLEINNIKNVILYNYACGDENCDVKMPVFYNYNCDNIINMGDITPNLGDFTSSSITKSIILDEFNFSSKVNLINLIKLDVQGWDKKVLMGATTLLIVEFEYFQLEKTNTTCKELFDFIRDQDYYIFYLEYSYPCDHICVHKDNLTEFRLKFENNILPHTENNHLNNNLINGVNEKIVI